MAEPSGILDREDRSQDLDLVACARANGHAQHLQLDGVAIERNRLEKSNAWLQRGNHPIENAAEQRALGGAPFIEELASGQVAAPEQTDAGPSQPPAIGLADRVALENAQPG